MSLIVILGLIYAVTAIPSTDPSDYGLFRDIPEGCDPTQDCIYFVGLNASGENLDVYLTAQADGWAAVGFSLTRSMQASDVIGCAVQSGSNMVEPMDTYNIEDGLFNNPDPNDDTMPGTIAEFVEGRITCTFSRSIVGTDDPPVDFNLDDDYFLLFGFDDDPAIPGGGFPQHDISGIGRPTILGRVNPVQDVGMIENEVVPNNVPAPQREPADYRLRRRTPEDCDPESCDYFMGIDTNVDDSRYLDFYLTADIDGWVAVGFSQSPNMFDADVLGCNLSPLDNEVFAVDTYNPSSTRTNNIDSDFSDIVMHSSSFQDGRITCIFSRTIEGADSSEDNSLDAGYYFLFGLGEDGGGLGSFPTHGNRIPLISDGRFNPANSGDDVEDANSSGDIEISRFRQQLLQAHGILMLIAWLYEFAL